MIDGQTETLITSRGADATYQTVDGFWRFAGGITHGLSTTGKKQRNLVF